MLEEEKDLVYSRKRWHESNTCAKKRRVFTSVHVQYEYRIDDAMYIQTARNGDKCIKCNVESFTWPKFSVHWKLLPVSLRR